MELAGGLTRLCIFTNSYYLSENHNTIVELSEIESLRKQAFSLEVINSFASELLHLTTVDQVVWAIAKHAVAKLGYVDCVVYLLDEEDGVLYQKAAHGPKNPIAHAIQNPIILQLGEGITGSVALTGVGEIISDTSLDERYAIDDEIRYSEITVPIISGNKVIGVIDSEHPEKDFYSIQDLEILKTIASMASVKIDQARYRALLEEKSENLQQEVAERTRELTNTIQKLQESYNQIKRSNQEKETLMKEIHHRVKNNLQIVSSLLNLHANKTTNPEDENVFRDCQNRIKSMSVIHEQLYNKSDLSSINASLYIEEICEELMESYQAKERVKIIFDLQKVFLNIEQSVPFGLILNELLVNSFKHGIPKGQGEIHITLGQSGTMIQLIVHDTGLGFDPKKIKESMGMELIETLSEQLNGTAVYSNNGKGTTCSVAFELI